MKLHLIKDENEELVISKPHWFIRNGNGLFAGLFAIPLILVFIIEYPDMINAKARLVALHPPKMIVSKTQGRLLQLFVEDDDSVATNQPLAIMESVANYFEVQALQDWMDSSLQSLKFGTLQDINVLDLPSFRRLGELQQDYQEFENLFLISKQTAKQGYYQQKAEVLKRDLGYMQRMRTSAGIQKKLIENDRSLQAEELRAYEQLAKDKVIAPLELNQYKSKLLLKDQGIQQLDELATTNELTALGKHKEILELKKQIADQQQYFRSSFFELRNKIEEWRSRYLLMAPQAGEVRFIASPDTHQLMQEGQPVMYVQPFDNNYYVELMVGQKGFGKIKPNQKVILKLDGFPSDEYGTIEARILTIANLPNRTDSFQIKAQLTHGLTTNYSREIGFTNNLAASAQIITDERKLMDRILGEVRRLWSR